MKGLLLHGFLYFKHPHSLTVNNNKQRPAQIVPTDSFGGLKPGTSGLQNKVQLSLYTGPNKN